MLELESSAEGIRRFETFNELSMVESARTMPTVMIATLGFSSTEVGEHSGTVEC